MIWYGSKGDLVWEQGFLLELVEEEIGADRPVVGVPNTIEAYSCDNPDIIPAAQVSLFSIDTCDSDQFDNHRNFIT